MKNHNGSEQPSSYAIAIALMTAVMAHPAVAQDRAEELATDEIVVTAQKREQSAQDVPISIAAFSGAQLAARGVAEVADIGRLAPNVQINYGFGLNAFNIRGVGINEFSANLDSPVAVHVDEVYLSKNFMTDLLLFDVDRVEILKGPQGTLFGRNTTGGAVNFYTRKPQHTSFAAGGTIGYDNFRTIRADGYATGPIGNGLAVRLAGFVTDQGQGFYRNITLGRDEWRVRKFGVRGQIAWEKEATSALLSVHYGRDRSELSPYEGRGVFTPASLAAGAPVLCAGYLNGSVNGATTGCVRGTDGQTPGDTNPRTSTNDLTHKVDNRSVGGQLRITHDLGSSTLTSISAYERFRRDAREDDDGSPGASFDVYWHQNIRQFSQELRLSSNDNDSWNYIVGAFYEHDDLYNADQALLGGGAVPGFFTEFDQSLDAFALFLHNEVKLSPALSLTAGARYNHERISIDGGTYFGPGQIRTGRVERPATILATLSSSQAVVGGHSRSDSAISFKMGLQWKPEIRVGAVDDLMIYGNVSTGFRSGGFNADFAISQDAFTQLGPERITAYEVGFKSELAQRKLRLNGAVFHYDFDDGVVNIDRPGIPAPVAVNAAAIKIWGAEVDARWRPVAGLEFSSGAGWLSAEISGDLTSTGISLDGNRPVNSPRFTYNGSARYEVQLGERLMAAASMDANWRSAQFLETLNEPVSREKGYWLVNANVSLSEADSRWSLTAWVKNLTETKYRSYINDLASFGFVLNVYGQPRTYGLTAGFKF